MRGSDLLIETEIGFGIFQGFWSPFIVDVLLVA